MQRKLPYAHHIAHVVPSSTASDSDSHNDDAIFMLPSKPKSKPSFLTCLASRSRNFHHQLCNAKKQASFCFTNLASILSLTFLLVFTLGAQTALHESPLSTPSSITAAYENAHSSLPFLSFYSTSFSLSFSSSSSPSSLHEMQRPPTVITSLQQQLHDYHSIPWRYINMLSTTQQEKFHQLLSTPVVNATTPSLKRTAVFAHITNCQLSQCLRAIASAVSYAQITNRVLLIFVDTMPDGTPITTYIHVNPDDAVFTDRAMLLSVPPRHPALVYEPSASLYDWAEFSTIEAVLSSPLDPENPPSAKVSYALQHYNTIQATQRDLTGIKDSNTPPYDSESPASQSKIGNTKTPATLDNLATIDTHVSMTLSEVVWSRYAPRTVQEGLFSTHFNPTSRTALSHIAKASLLGRHSSTRKLSVTDAKLHDVYKVPRMLLRGMSPLSRKLLLLKFETKQRRGISKPRAIFVHTQYGLGNRLRALGSAMALARRTDRVLVLIWVPDQHLNCFYTDLFVPSDEFIISDAFEPGEAWPFRENARSDIYMSHVRWYNYMPVNGVKVRSSGKRVYNERGLHIYVSTCYVIQSSVTPFITRTTSSFWKVLKALTPQISVIRLVERFASYPMSKMIGIHIRGKSIKADISGVDKADYTEESSRTTDYWRNLTQVETFIEEMRRQTPDQLFYVAADEKEIFSRLEREFPSRVFFTPRHCDSRDRDCLPFALADILLLAKCSSLRGSYWSSFSELSTRIGGARFLLAGVDFGRPQSSKVL